MSIGKAVRVWQVEVRQVPVRRVWSRQSCLGTLRRGAVTFGELRRGSRGKLWRCEVWRVLAGLGSQGFAGYVTVERGEAGQSTVGRGSRGLVRRGEL